jgi:GGDEF domain-containing protein
MSLQGPIVVVAAQADAALVKALESAGASPVVTTTWPKAAAVVMRSAPAALVVADARPDATPAAIDKLSQAIDDQPGPYMPVIARVAPDAAPILSDALPIAADASNDRIVARLGSALRLRTLHATVLRRSVAPADKGDGVPLLPETDPLDDATVLVTGRGRSYPGLTTAVGERVGLIGALSVETAARYLNARDVDGIVIGEGFGPRTVEAFLTALTEDTRFRDLPVALMPELPASIDRSRLPNLERLQGEPADVVASLLPLVRLRAFEARLRRQLASLDADGMLDPATGLFTIAAFLRDLARAMEDAHQRSVALSISRFTFPPTLGQRSSIDAARLVSRLVRNVDFACRASDGSILLAFSGTPLRNAHVVARRIASVLRHTMLSDEPETQGRIDASVTLASVKPTDTVETLLARVSEPTPVAAA